ncbi:aminotransferase class I/II-fold pyridoxal phosphate-dependent enzyme [Stenotrophomonas sp. NPDC087984]
MGSGWKVNARTSAIGRLGGFLGRPSRGRASRARPSGCGRHDPARPAPPRSTARTAARLPADLAEGSRTKPPAAVFDWIDRRTELRRRAGLTRHLRPRPADEPLPDLAGNDYLGPVRHPRVVRAATEAMARRGGGATGSRLVTGTTLPHQELEGELAASCGFAAALVFSCGYTANLAALTALTGPGTLIVFDALRARPRSCRRRRQRRAVGRRSGGFPDVVATVTLSKALPPVSRRPGRASLRMGHRIIP